MNTTQEHLTLTNPNTQDSINLSHREISQIWDSLDRNPDTLDLSIRIGNWLDNQGIPHIEG